MISTVTLKANAATSSPTETSSITLTQPSVVTVHFGPEDVARFDKVGDDLLLVLKNGQRITITDFFVIDEDGGRSDIVFLDEYGVTWWGQYAEPWECFHIAEIETEFAPLAFTPLGLAPLLGLLAAGAAAAAISGGGGSDDDDPELVAEPDVNAVIEAGVVDGGNITEDGNPQVTGNVLLNDNGADATGLTVVGVSSGGVQGAPGEAIEGVYGTLVLNPDGSYTYTVDNSDPDTQSLAAGDTAVEEFTYVIQNENGDTVETTLSITVTGTNDAPVLSEEQSGAVQEDGELTATGQFTVTDPDAGDTQTFSVVGSTGTFGVLVIDDMGNWTYDLDNASPEVQALAEGEVVTDTIRIRVTDSDGAISEQNVVITITGANERPEPVDDAATTPQGQPVTVNLLGNDTDADPGETAQLSITEIDGQPVTVGSPITLSDGSGVITVNADGTVTFEPAPGFDGEITVPYVVDDGSGSDNATNTANLVLTVVDATPVAVDDVNSIPAGSSGPATGNIVTGPGTDTPGADGATVTSVLVNGVETPVPATGNIDIVGEFGVLTISADGTYSYVRDPNSPGGVQDVFSYVLTDGDGDTGTADLTINIGDSPVTISGLTPDADDPDAIVNESGLPDGTNAGSGEDSTTGSFTVAAFDGVSDLTITVGGEEIAIVSGGVPADLTGAPLTITSALGSTLTITGFDPATGEVTYEYALNDGETHPEGAADGLFDDFTVNLTDTDGDTNSATLSIEIIDDVPTIAPADSSVALVASDADLNTDPSADFSDLFAVDFGADEQDPVTPRVYTLDVPTPGVDSGVVDGATGEPVLLFEVDGVLEGRVGDDVAFTISVDAETGVVTLDQQRPLEHPVMDEGAAGTDDVTLDLTAVVLTLTVEDSDGDTATQSIDIGDRLSVLDDVPIASVLAPADAVVPDLLTQDADTLFGPDTATADFSGLLPLDNDFGNDGAAATGSVESEFGLQLVGGEGPVPSGLTAGGAGIFLYLIDGEIVGSTATDLATVTPGNSVFTLETDAAGNVTQTQLQPLDQQGTGTDDETVNLADGLVELTRTVTITDSDGDTSTDSASVDIGGSFNFQDDALAPGETPPSVVIEAGLRAPGSTITATQVVNLELTTNPEDVTVAFDPNQMGLEDLGLESDGVPLDFTITDGVITASAGGVEVFNVVLTPPNAGNDFQTSYTYTQSAVLDHLDGDDMPLDALVLPFALIATDADADETPLTFVVSVQDDVPTAVDDAPQSTVEGGDAVGTDNGAANLFDNDILGADDADGPTLHQVQYVDANGDTQTVLLTGDSIELDAQFGTLTVNADGTWNFVPDMSVANVAGLPADATFSYSLIDTDGDISPFADQPISITDTSPVAIDDAAITLVEAGANGTGNVISNDTASQDLPLMIDNFTYTDADGVETTFTFASTDPASETVTTPTGTLTVSNNGDWIFEPIDSFDHDAPDADPTQGSFSYVLSDSDGSLSNSATQGITVLDSGPVSTSAAATVSEANLPNGTAPGSATATQDIAIQRGGDAIADVLFTPASIAALPTLESNGTELVFTISDNGHTLTATAGAGGPEVFSLVINDPADGAGAGTQSVTATLLAPLDQPGAASTVLTIPYDVVDIDGTTISGDAVFTIDDDVPLTPVNDTPVTVVEGAGPVGSGIGDGINLLENDVLGADATGAVNQITYTDPDGALATADVVAGGTTVTTLYGELTVAPNGTWSYTPLDTVDHVQPANDTTLNDNFTYTTTDSDGDVSPSSATQVITVTDTVPVIGDPDDVTFDEANLPAGTDPEPVALTATGSLDLLPGQDTFNTTITSTPEGLQSGGVALQYVTSADGQSVQAFAGPGRTAADQIFTVALTNPTAPNAGYTVTLTGPLDQEAGEDLDFDFGVTITDSDGDTDQDTFTVTVAGDAPLAELAVELDEDGSIPIVTSADSSPDATTIVQNGVPLTGVTQPDGTVVYNSTNGTVTVQTDGSLVYEPADDFSGQEVFSFVIDTGTGAAPTSTEVTATVNPISDTPALTVDNANINTLEDTAVGLGLNAPVIADDGTGPGNNPTTERIGLITLAGVPDGAVLEALGIAPFTADGNPITIQISDIPTLTSVDGTADLTLTTAQYEALTVLPPEHTNEEFTVAASVASFEVDAAGNQLAGVAGAPQTTEVIVDVQAVTDDVSLIFDTGVTSPANVDTITYTGNTTADVGLAEDATFSVNDILLSAFEDLDGSEVRSLTFTNGSDQPIVVNGTTVAAGAAFTVDALTGTAGQTGTIASFPDIQFGGGANVSGPINGITLTVNAQDVDADGFLDAMGNVVPGPADGVPEADTSNNSVTLNLAITPVAGDVEVLGVTGLEDTEIPFLSGVSVTDTDGSEVINTVVFEVPAGFTFVPATGVGFTTVTDGSGVTTIDFTGGVLTQAEREAALDDFTITPPAHSSLDADIPLTITTTDTNGAISVDGTTSETLTVTVEPVAERIDTDPALADTDGDGLPDLTMNGDFQYDANQPINEDGSFALNTQGFDFQGPWNNQDTDESTFARLVPLIVDGAPDDSLIGSQFTWIEDGVTQTGTFSGAGVDIPIDSLSTVQFLPAPDFAGQVDIAVTAFTVDIDDDDDPNGPGLTATAESGGALLQGIIILPVAEAAALTLTAQVVALEDERTPLMVRPSSTDPSETFIITIREFPAGAQIFYEGVLLTVMTDADGPFVQIPDFDRDAPLEIQPPFNSNDDFTLNVQAQTSDSVTINGTTLTEISPVTELELNVDVRGVPDPVDITATPQTFIEAELDDGSDTVLLSELASIDLFDDDGSETLTVRVTGLEDGFSVVGGSLLSGTGTDRIFAVSAATFDTATISVPDNFSGDVVFAIDAVTTEDDGASAIGGAAAVSFTVTPSPEATIVTSAIIVENAITPINFSVVPQNGDEDETLGNVRVNAADATTGDFRLFVDQGGTFVELTAATFPPVNGFFELTAEQAQSLAAQPINELDADLGSFGVEFEIIDENFGAVPSGDTATSAFQPATFSLTGTPVTDQPATSITAITGANTAASDQIVGNDANPDTAVISDEDQVTVTLNVASIDFDGSERVTRVLIENIPSGVTVLGAQAIGAGTALLVFDGAESISINDAGGIEIDVVFDVSDQVTLNAATDITLTAQVQDRGDQGDPGTATLSDPVTFNLETSFGESGANAEVPADIDLWEFNANAVVFEDTPIALSELINSDISTNSTEPNTLTVQLTNLPEGTVTDGLTRTVINGVETFTASVTSMAGDDEAAVQALLDALLATLTIAAPENFNSDDAANPAPGGLPFTATLTSSVLGGDGANSTDFSAEPDVEPVTDPAVITVDVGGVDDNGVLQEDDPAIELTLNVTNDADGVDASIVDGFLYVQINGSDPDLNGGTLVVDGQEITATPVTGIPGVPDGDYFVIPNAELNTPIDATYNPTSVVPGDITVDVFTQNVESDSFNVTSSATQVLPIELANDGVTVTSAESNGLEPDSNDLTQTIQLEGLTLELNDADGSEELQSILLTGVPEGFLVIAGPDEANAVALNLSSNAGGADGLNTWIVPDIDGALPEFIAILPPQNWSGTVDTLALAVTSGETALSDSLMESIPLEPLIVAPVANGVALESTPTFGNENEIVPLNLNLALIDAVDATVTTNAPDASTESVTLSLTGLGEFASFFVGTTEFEDVTFDAATDTYTLTGLSQSDIDALGFQQAVSSFTDTDAGTDGLQIGVTAFSIETAIDDPSVTLASDPADSATVTVVVESQLATSGDDTLLYTAAPIDALAGADTIAIRQGENLTGTDLAANLTNVETLDLSIGGANVINGLTAQQVLAMTDDNNTLTINGTTDDTVNLTGFSSSGPGVFTATVGGNTVTVNVNLTAPPAMAAAFNSGPAAFASFLVTEEPSFGLSSFALEDEETADKSASTPQDEETVDTAVGDDDEGAIVTAAQDDDEPAVQQPADTSDDAEDAKAQEEKEAQASEDDRVSVARPMFTMMMSEEEEPIGLTVLDAREPTRADDGDAEANTDDDVTEEMLLASAEDEEDLTVLLPPEDQITTQTANEAAVGAEYAPPSEFWSEDAQDQVVYDS